MPLLVDPVLSHGIFTDAAQPRLTANDGLALRPWRPNDTAAVQAAFACPDIQRWHVRRLDSVDEADEWINQWAERWNNETSASWAAVDEDDRLRTDA